MNVLIILCSVLIISFVSLRIFYDIRKIKYVKEFNSYLAVLEFHMEKSYEMIYKDRMMIFSVEATKVTDDQFNEYAKEFAVLVLYFLGPMLHKELVNLYGNEETLFFNIIEYFNVKYENDEIRESSMDNLMNKDQLSE